MCGIERKSIFLSLSLSYFLRYPVPKFTKKLILNHCCGSKTFWCGSRSGSGSADPCLCLMDPDPAIFVIVLQEANKKEILKKSFSACYL
jgi:hypothetical protein